MHTNTIIWQWCTVCAQNSFDLIYRLLWTPKSATILDHKPRQRKTGATNQKHLSCERFFFSFSGFIFFFGGRVLAEMWRPPPHQKKAPIEQLFFFSFFNPTGEWIFLSLWKPSVRIFQHVTTSRTQTISERRERQRGGRRVRHGEKRGRQMKERRRGEWPTHNHIKPNAPYQKDGWGRRQTPIHSLKRSKFLLPILLLWFFAFFGCFFNLSFIFWLANSHFLISHCLSHFYLHHLLRFPLLIAYFFPPMSHFAFVPPHSSSFSLSTFHLFPACASLCKTQISKKWSAKSFFYSVLPSFTCKNNCNNNLSNSIIKCFLSVPALPPSPPSLIITVQIHQITKHVFYVKP